MRYIVAFVVALCAAFFSIPGQAIACHDGNDMRSFTHNTVKVSVEINGVRHYELAGSCATDTNRPHPEHNMLKFTSMSTWNPSAKRAVDRVQGGTGWVVSSVWNCSNDPWLSYFSRDFVCHLVSYDPTGSPPPITQDNRPFSSLQTPYEELGRLIKKNTPPPPALPPLNVSASFYQQRVRLSWALPQDHTSLHPTVAWFRVERHPVGQQTVSWFPASKSLPAAQFRYDDPDPIRGETEYRVCAVNVSGAMCSGPVKPIFAALTTPPQAGQIRQMPLAQRVREMLAQRFSQASPRIKVESASSGKITLTGTVNSTVQRQEIEQAVRTVQGVTSVDNQLMAIASTPPKHVDMMTPNTPSAAVPEIMQKPTPGQASALNPQPLPPKSIPGVMQRPSAGQDRMLNPQPLPPKTVSPGMIMRRGVDDPAPDTEQQQQEPQNDSPPAGP